MLWTPTGFSWSRQIVSALLIHHERRGAIQGQVLSIWGCRRFDGMVNHHLISPDTEEIIHAVPTLAPYREVISGRATLCWKTAVFPVECVVPGYLSLRMEGIQQAPAPQLPPELVQATSRRYQDAFRRITVVDQTATNGR